MSVRVLIDRTPYSERMSKTDAMQAMREARYAATLARTAQAPDRVVPAATTPVLTAEQLCGHRSMNNRNCRRPAGHPEKNHRYT